MLLLTYVNREVFGSKLDLKKTATAQKERALKVMLTVLFVSLWEGNETESTCYCGHYWAYCTGPG
jgi:hypothetical protein